MAKAKLLELQFLTGTNQSCALASVELNEDQFCHEITKYREVGNTPVKRRVFAKDAK